MQPHLITAVVRPQKTLRKHLRQALALNMFFARESLWVELGREPRWLERWIRFVEITVDRTWRELGCKFFGHRWVDLNLNIGDPEPDLYCKRCFRNG